LSESGLARLDGYLFEARYSVGAEAEAVRLAELAKDAYAYFRRLFPDTEPKITARFLTRADWPVAGYGVPAYDPFDRSLRIATEDNRFYQSFGKMARLASPFGAYPRLKRTYADAEGRLQLRRFFDLLVVHELESDWDQHRQDIRRRIDDAKATEDLETMELRAEWAEADARNAVDFAANAIDEAKYAMLDAILARKDVSVRAEAYSERSS